MSRKGKLKVKNITTFLNLISLYKRYNLVNEYVFVKKTNLT